MVHLILEHYQHLHFGVFTGQQRLVSSAAAISGHLSKLNKTGKKTRARNEWMSRRTDSDDDPQKRHEI